MTIDETNTPRLNGYVTFLLAHGSWPMTVAKPP